MEQFRNDAQLRGFVKREGGAQGSEGLNRAGREID